MTILKPRYYQDDAVNAAFDYMRDNDGNPLIVMPTGTGKSLVAALFMMRLYQRWKSRIVLITHVQELIQQDNDAVFKLWPDCNVSGQYCAALRRRDDKPLLFASIQSIYKKAYDFDPFDIIIIDEAHRVNHKQVGMYHKFIKDCRINNPHLRVLGLTATDYRLEGGCLTDGKEKLFDDVCYNVGIREMTDAGFLAPIVSKPAKVQPDLSKVRIRMGDYVEKDLSEAMRCGVTEAALDEACDLGRDRKSWLAFCVSVAHAEQVKASLNDRGILTEVLHGGTPKPERARILSDFKAGKIRCVSNCMVLTTGFDAPNIDMIILLRPTQSASLFVQMVGRGTRIAPGKVNCLCLDFARLLLTHGPIDKIKVVRTFTATEGTKSKIKTMPSRECFKCQALVSIASKECPDCGYVFPMSDIIDHEVTASTKSFMHELEAIPVAKVQYFVHHKNGRASLRVEYFKNAGWSFESDAKEWICLEHHGRARKEAEKWWKRRSDLPVPTSVADAIKIAKEDGLNHPVGLKIDVNGKFTKIVSYLWEAN